MGVLRNRCGFMFPAAKIAEKARRNSWWALQDLNLGPMDYESTALTAELRAQPKANLTHALS